MLKKFGLEDSKPTKTPMSTEIKLTKDDEADSVDSSKYRDNESTVWRSVRCLGGSVSLGTRVPKCQAKDYKKTRAYAPKIYNDPNMSDALRDIYRNLESRYVHEGRTINPSFYNDLSDDLVVKFTAIGFYCLLSLDEQICPRNLKSNMPQHPFDARYKLVLRKMSSLKAKQPKRPPTKRARNVGKSKCTQLSTPFSTESPPSDNRDLPSTKISLRSYSRVLKDDPNMSKEQRETIGMFKNLGRALHNFARLLKKECC
ncbi:hypothetical protein Tco_0013583 [Tanacetum coccineum]